MRPILRTRKIIGGFDPSNLATNVAANWTDASGQFSIQIRPGVVHHRGPEEDRDLRDRRRRRDRQQGEPELHLLAPAAQDADPRDGPGR